MTHGIIVSKSSYSKIKDERTHIIMILYVLTIGPIMYTMLCTRPDVSFTLNVMSRYQLYLGKGHWVAIKNIL